MALSKPTENSDWTVGNPSFGTITVEPGAAKKLTGWNIDEKPPREFMNWLFFITDSWIKYLESVTDEVLGQDIVTVGASGLFSDLQTAHDDGIVTPRTKILVLDNFTVDAPILISKPNIEIEFRGGVTYSKGTAANALLISPTADRIKITGGRFTGFSAGGNAAIDVDVAVEFVMFRDMLFFDNTKDIEENTNTTLSSEGHITE